MKFGLDTKLLTTLVAAGVFLFLIAGPAPAALKLQQIGEVAGLNKPESAVSDPDTGYVYISNINGDTADLDGNGYITRVDNQGLIETREWFGILAGGGPLNGPKGLAIYDGNLYIADINRIVRVKISDTSDSSVINTTRPAGFLNDVAIDQYGNVFVTDSNQTSADIFVKTAGSNDAGPWLATDPSWNNPNGIVIHDGRLIIGYNNGPAINYIELTYQNQEPQAPGALQQLLGNARVDGIAVSGQYFFFSDGESIYYFKNGAAQATLLVNIVPDRGQTWGPADIALGRSDDKLMLFSPNLGLGTLTAYEVIFGGSPADKVLLLLNN